MMGFWLQLKLLLWKNFITKKRKLLILFVETLILMTFFIVFAVVRLAETPIHVEPQRFRALPLPSAGLLPVLQELCCPPENEMDDNGFYPNNGEKFHAILRSMEKSFLSFGVSLDELENIPKTFRAIAKGSVVVNEFIKALPGAIISDIFRDPNETANYLENSLSVQTNNVKLLFNSPLNLTEVISYLHKRIGDAFVSRQVRSIGEIYNFVEISNILTGFLNLAQRRTYDNAKTLLLSSVNIQGVLCSTNDTGNDDLLGRFCGLHSNDAHKLVAHLLDNLNYDLIKEVKPYTKLNPLVLAKDIEKMLRSVKVSIIFTKLLQKITNLMSEFQYSDGVSFLDSVLNCKVEKLPVQLRQRLKKLFNVSDDIGQTKSIVGFTFENETSSLTTLFTGRTKILYAPKNSDVDKIIKRVNETLGLSMLQTITDYATSYKKMAAELESYLRKNYAIHSVNGVKTIVEYFELDSDFGRLFFDKEQLLEHLGTLDSIASAWLHFVLETDLDLFVGFQDESALLNYVQYEAHDENVQVLAGLSFVMNGDGSLPQHVTYSIRQNASLFASTAKMKFRHRYQSRILRSSFYYYSGFVFLQDLIDRAIVSLHSGRDVIEPGNYIQEFPFPCYSKDKFVEGLEHMLPICAVFSWVFVLAILVQNIVREKEFRLKEVMKAMGMSELVHSLSWFLVSLFFVTIWCILMTAILVLGAVLPNSEASFIFVIMQLYGISIIALSFLLSSLFSKAKVASACAGIVYFLMYVPSMYVGLQSEFNNSHVSIWSILPALLLCPATFSRIIVYMSYYEEMGSGARWSNWHQSPVDKDTVTIGSMILFLPLDSLIYLVLTWYITNVHPGIYGLPRPWNFPITKSYWMEVYGLNKCNLTKTKNNCRVYSPLNDESSMDNEVTTIPAENRFSSSEHRRYFEPDPANFKIGVRIDRLGKCFGEAGDKVAVKDLSLNFYEGQITAFLGHNGAGKTTTISILTGIIPPSSGRAIIYGLDIRHDMVKIRQNLGICPQHNVLFNELTVEEHIQFYASLKGVKAKILTDEMNKIIHDAGLDGQRNRSIDCLGGGMKRMLSVAIAFIGGSRTVILDEPTSGIDPCSRRAIWDLILMYKKDRTIILSTHDMDEAETLGDRVAIIANGQIQCCGSPVHLKNNLGSGYHLYLASRKMVVDETTSTSPILVRESADRVNGNASSNQWEATVTSFIRKHIATVHFVSESLYELHYVLPISELKMGNFERLFGAIDKCLEFLNIASYGVKSPTLEEVFLLVSADKKEQNSKLTDQSRTRGHARSLTDKADDSTTGKWTCSKEFSADVTVDFSSNRVLPLTDDKSRLRKRKTSYLPLPTEDADIEIGVNEDIHQLEFGGFVGISRTSYCRVIPFLQMKAIIEKRYLCTCRNKKALLSQIILPAIFVAVAMAVALIVPSFDDPPPLDLSTTQFKAVTERGGHFVVFSNAHQDEKQWRSGEDASSNQLESTLLLPSGIGAACVLKSRNTEQAAILSEESFESLCAGAVFKEDFRSLVDGDQQERSRSLAAHNPAEPRRYHPTCQCQGTLSRSFVCSGNYEKPPFLTLLTGETLLNISGHKELEYFLNTKVLYMDQRYGALTFGITRKTMPQEVGEDSSFVYNKLLVKHTAKAWYDSSGFHAMPIFVNALNNVILRANLPAEKGNPAAYGITTINHPLPNTNSLAQYEDLLMGTNLVIAVFVITAMAFVPASFVLNLVYEKQSKAKHLHIVAGVTPIVYWTGNFIWDLMNYFIPATCCIVILLLFNIPAYTEGSNFTAVILLFLVYGWAMTPAMYPFSFHFKEPSVAFLFLVVLNLFLGLTCLSIVLTLAMETKHQFLQDIAGILDNMFVIFPNYCLGKGLMDLALLDYKNCYFTKIGKAELVQSPFSWNYIPKKLVAMAVSGASFFCVTLFCERISRKSPNKLDVGGDSRKGVLDEDVAAENKRVLQGGAKRDVLQLVNLTKVYQEKKLGNSLAVDNICVGIPRGECFGLVGVNGAGKTTTFLMLTGDTNITSGDAILNGHSVGHDFKTARRFVGYCPQFDALYDELTAREHLRIYSYFHGIPQRRQKKVIDWALKKLDLMSYADQQTHTFSGGTKRKLSTALALLGNPAVIFLDEPTTGMDPRSKRFLWEVILDVVRGPEGQSVVLTSHSMEECEALCDRLTVMVDGRFCCLGSVQYLKDRFGGGYSLSVRLRNDGSAVEAAQIASVHQLITTSFPKAVLKECHSNVLHYELKSSDVSLAYVFSCMEAALTKLQMEDYSVCQNTLDNVSMFVKDVSLEHLPAEIQIS